VAPLDAEAGPGSGIVTLANLQALGSQVLISVGAGSVTGHVDVKGLGVAGAGSTAVLTGTVNGVGGPNAADLGFHLPHPETGDRLNSCPIGAFSCIVLPQVAPVQTPPTDTLQLFQARPTGDPIDIDRLNTGNEDDL
jgi:hypothetical protein